jgi:hypothetical protein
VLQQPLVLRCAGCGFKLGAAGNWAIVYSSAMTTIRPNRRVPGRADMSPKLLQYKLKQKPLPHARYAKS